VDASRFGLTLRVKRFGNKFAVGFFEENLDPTFRFLKLLLAFAGEGHAFFKKLHGIIERKLRALQPTHHFFQACERAFEVRFFGWFGFLGNRGIHSVSLC